MLIFQLGGGIVALRRPFHKFFRILLDILILFWMMEQEFIFGKTYGERINDCLLNFQVFSKL